MSDASYEFLIYSMIALCCMSCRVAAVMRRSFQEEGLEDVLSEDIPHP